MKNQQSQRGFTLLELLIVMVIAGVMLGVVSFNALPNSRQRLENDAKRLALLFQLARDEAILRNMPVSFDSDQFGYRFMVREDRVWTPLKDDMLRERSFELSPLELGIDPPQNQAGVHIVFGREPVDKPFVLTLKVPDASIKVMADGVGHYSVE
ncbi:GspH/FimT family pseudopilin [Undibacterium sp. RuRC25W]|uniref:GspH/FimT family pseudopilin n=1 Tax=Undibacterium sp. RuRC25W TaxID=3413047 RepID=UPI003BEF632B